MSGSELKSPVTDTLRTPMLLDNPYVQLPEHEYSNFAPELVVAFHGLAAAYSGLVSRATKQFPNARLIVNFPPSGNSNYLPFMAAWGKRTEYPLPRDYKIPDYFSRRERMAALVRNKPLQRTTLDARGFLGYLTPGRDNSGVHARILHGTKSGQLYYTEYEDLTPQSSYLLLENVINYKHDAAPLHFHAGGKYWPHSRYIFNEFSSSSQHRLLDQR